MILVENVIIEKSKDIIAAMKQIDRNGLGIAVVCDRKKVVGVVTDGDIRRAIINGAKLATNIEKIANLSPVLLTDRELADKEGLKKNLSRKMGFGSVALNMIIPVINAKKQLQNLMSVHYEREGEVFYDPLLNTHRTVRNVKRVLLIGGAGYLGSVLSRELLKKKYYVRVLDNLTYGDSGIKDLYGDPNFELKKGDMRNISDVVDAIKEVDAVIQIGAIVGDPAGILNPQKTLEINYHATDMIVRVCKYHQINRFIFASTCSVYGKSANAKKLLSENSALAPVSLYAETKIEAEGIILGAAQSNFSPTIMRMATIFGYSPRMRFDLVANILMAKAYYENQIPIFGGNQYRPLVHVRDAAIAYIKCLETPLEKVDSQIFNVGSEDMNYQIEDLGKEIRKIFPKAKMTVQKDDKDARTYCVDFSKIRKTLGFKTVYTIKKGAEELLAQFKSGSFHDFADKVYSNVNSLKDKSEKKQ